MSESIDWTDGPWSEPSESNILRAVVTQHIVDGQTSGSPTAAALAQSLITELDAAGLDISSDVDALRETQADEQRAAGE